MAAPIPSAGSGSPRGKGAALQMTGEERARFAAYRDAVGMLLAIRRADEDAMSWFAIYQPTMRTNAFNGLLGVAIRLMREIDDLGGDATELVQKLAMTVAMNEADKMNPEDD